MKRIVSGLMWTFVVMWAGTFVAVSAGLPAVVSLPFAVAVGGFVFIDPMMRIWPRAIKQSTALQESPRTATELLRTI